MDSLQAAQRSVRFLAHGCSYSSNTLYKATAGRKMTERHFTGYVLLVPAVSGPVCLILGVWLRFRDSHSPVTPQPLLQALAQIQHHLPMLAFIPKAHWAQQVRLLTHPFTSSLVPPGLFPWTVWPFISPSKGQPPLANSEDSPSPVPCACSLLLIPSSEQTQSLSQIMMLQGSVCPTHSFPNGPFWLCGFREQPHQGRNSAGGCAEPHASVFLKCHNICNIIFATVQLSFTSAKSLPRLRSCFNCRRTKSFPSPLSGTSFHRWLLLSCCCPQIHQSEDYWYVSTGNWSDMF